MIRPEISRWIAQGIKICRLFEVSASLRDQHQFHHTIVFPEAKTAGLIARRGLRGQKCVLAYAPRIKSHIGLKCLGTGTLRDPGIAGDFGVIIDAIEFDGAGASRRSIDQIPSLGITADVTPG